MDTKGQLKAKKTRRPGGGRKPKLTGELMEALRHLAEANPSLSLEDLTARFVAESPVAVGSATVRKSLAAAGVRQLRPRRAASIPAAGTAEPRATRYGYKDFHRDEGEAGRYPNGLTDAEWSLVADLFENRGPGVPPKYPRRKMIDAITYAVRGGVPWRMLPADFPPWQDVYAHFRRWTTKNLFEIMHDRLRAMWRQREHRAPEPTAAIVDSQSIKTSAQGGPKGFDGGKKVKGRKRHLVTDTLGLLLAVLITPASVQDRDAAQPALALAKAKYPTIKRAFVDSGYLGKCIGTVRQELAIEMEIAHRPSSGNTRYWSNGQLPLLELPSPKDFVPLPKRWAIERTNAWNDRPGRMAKDQDRRLDVSASWIWFVEARMLLRRVTQPILGNT